MKKLLLVLGALGAIGLAGCLRWPSSDAVKAPATKAVIAEAEKKAEILEAKAAALPAPQVGATAEAIAAYQSVVTGMRDEAASLRSQIADLKKQDNSTPWWQLALLALGSIAGGMYGVPALGASAAGSAIGVVGDLVHRFLGGHTPIGHPGPDPGAPGTVGVIQTIVGNNVDSGMSGMIQSVEDLLKITVANALRPKA